MNQYQTERRLSWCYGLLAFLLGVSAICVAVTYNHWRATLDVCPSSWLENANCGCIFYGVSTFNNFNGGHNSFCLYAIFAPLPILVYALVMALFHMYRVCINNVGQYEDDKQIEIEEIENQSIVVTTRMRATQRNDGVIYCWIPTSSIAAIFCIYNIVHAIIITDGYIKSCTQYRGYLAKTLNTIGSQVGVIHFRLSCHAIYDFMDYMLQNNLNSRQGDSIYTGVALELAIFASWMSVALWIAVSVFTAIRAYKERHVLTCCGK